MTSKATRSDYSRVWTIENGAAPGRTPTYQGSMKVGNTTYGFGDVSRVERPSDVQYGKFEEVLEVPGAIDRPTTTLMGRYPLDASDLLRLGRKGCRIDTQIHIGTCEDPRDFNHGWQKIRFYDKARITSYSDENMGALASDDRAVVNETVDLSARDVYEMVRKRFSQRASTLTTLEVVAIDVCDAASCGDCGPASAGDNRIVAVMKPSGASPGTAPKSLYSTDGGDTWAATLISSLLGNEPPIDAECVGENHIVISAVDQSLHYATKLSLFAGTASYQQVITGFVNLKGPNAIDSAGPRDTWIVGNGGYIYYTTDPTTGVSVQDAGQSTVQNLLDVDALDSTHVVTVGASNAVVFTENGGESWTAVVGPAVGVNLGAVLMLDENTWLVGTATGLLYYTQDQGTTWAAIGLPLVATAIKDIKAITAQVLVLALTIAGPGGRILQSIDAGRSWYVMPEGTGSIIANDQINQIGVAVGNPNVFFAAGLADDGAAGIILKAA